MVDVSQAVNSAAFSVSAIELLRQMAVQPPSTGITAPVMNEASSLARKSTAAATSRGWPSRPMGVLLICRCVQLTPRRGRDSRGDRPGAKGVHADVVRSEVMTATLRVSPITACFMLV